MSIGLRLRNTLASVAFRRRNAWVYRRNAKNRIYHAHPQDHSPSGGIGSWHPFPQESQRHQPGAAETQGSAVRVKLSRGGREIFKCREKYPLSPRCTE